MAAYQVHADKWRGEITSTAGGAATAVLDPPVSAPTWLGDVYSLVGQNRLDEGIDILFHHVDDLLGAGKADQCDSLLRAVDLKRLNLDLTVALLSITLGAAVDLPYRARLVFRAERLLKTLAPDRAERLLNGLR